MSVYTKFAIIGAGGVGATVVDELLKKGDAVSVAILTRDETKPELQAFKARGATLHQVSYDDANAIKNALSGSEVVVSTVSAYHLNVQKDIIPAAKEAGIQLFVPSEYGVTVTEGPNVTKKEVQDLLAKHEIPATIFYTGLFAEYLPFILGFNFQEGYMNVVGKGETAFSITPQKDVGHFVAHVLSTAPKSALSDAKIPFESERLSPMQIRDLAEKKLNKKIEVRYIDFEENKKKYDTDFVAFLTTLFEDGRGVAGTEEEVQESVAKFFPDWNPAKLILKSTFQYFYKVSSRLQLSGGALMSSNVGYLGKRGASSLGQETAGSLGYAQKMQALIAQMFAPLKGVSYHHLHIGYSKQARHPPRASESTLSN
ncbi:E [Plasmopara halstedii]|uniref:E n=1 Tax=Plasmopara halstedii TaxID=4781 RepID=A0A0P1B6U3_PLAHL|nr:E [Plasmopara halstedii] [Plasmopara halstedii]CEG50526.1 E [Plasmopara halstedii] [Plasmopara halstedii]|eukprot:XP_024586895.1 E [Plasmopara halstedii]